MVVLLAGSTGFLGSHLLRAFVNNGHQVVALKRSSSDVWRIKDVMDKAIFYDSDRVELKEVFRGHKVDVVINTVTIYGRTNSRYSNLMDVNVSYGLKLLEETVAARAGMYVNTDTMLAKGISPYALSKSHFREWLSFFSNNGVTKIVNVKIEHMYGPLDDAEKFVGWLVSSLRNNADVLNLTSGLQKRDFIFIDDVVRAYETILRNRRQFRPCEEFELGSGESIAVRDFVKCIIETARKYHKFTTKVNFGAKPHRPGEDFDMVADIDKMKKLGWAPKVSVTDGIQSLFQSF